MAFMAHLWEETALKRFMPDLKQGYNAHTPSLPNLTRQSILSKRLLGRMMDARVKPAHDER
jgi:hypothetical protein